MTPNLTAFTGVDSQNLPDVMVSVQFVFAIGEELFSTELAILGSFSVSNDGKLDIAQAFRLILMMFWST
ncbi:hypothetical protein PF586_10265 [Lactobacillus delbrueckii]|uniref:Uncharacterized protein n=1 Tax=Lactobacillus delbrueckii TaxID=1584 RepID=A0AAW5Z165_9LACO|nr:hypothetical protein [Lactobacillus delbrueckii]MDA3768762.1 hypothetical protein [Lactobacillus delbrueckii]